MTENEMLKHDLFIRKKKNGDIAQSLYIGSNLMHYTVGDIRSVFTISVNPFYVKDAKEMAEVINFYRDGGTKLRNYSAPATKRNRAAEKKNTDHGVYSFGIMMPETEEQKHRPGRRRVYSGMIDYDSF